MHLITMTISLEEEVLHITGQVSERYAHKPGIDEIKNKILSTLKEFHLSV